MPMNWKYKVGRFVLYAPNGDQFASIGEKFDMSTQRWESAAFVEVRGVPELMEFPTTEEAKTFLEASYLLQFGD